MVFDNLESTTTAGLKKLGWGLTALSQTVGAVLGGSCCSSIVAGRLLVLHRRLWILVVRELLSYLLQTLLSIAARSVVYRLATSQVSRAARANDYCRLVYHSAVMLVVLMPRSPWILDGVAVTSELGCSRADPKPAMVLLAYAGRTDGPARRNAQRAGRGCEKRNPC